MSAAKIPSLNLRGLDTCQNASLILRKWGANPPQWIAVLADECDRTGQSKCAERLNVSAAMVNQALQNTYKGRLDRLEERVRGELMRETHECPVLGAISKMACLEHQAQPFSTTSRLAVRLSLACPHCPNRRAT